MYKPVPPRPKKTNIVRSRSGCSTCRKRRVKCDEKKPICGLCARLGKVCEPLKLEYEFRIVNSRNGPWSPNIAQQHQPSPNEPHIEVNTTEVIEAIGAGDLEGDDQTDFFGTQGLTTRSIVNVPGDCLDSEAMSPLPVLSYEHGLSSDISLLTRQRKMDNESFYSMYWDNHCADAIDKLFGNITMLGSQYEPLKDAILALSACNFSRSMPDTSEEKDSGQIVFRPQHNHLISSQEYYRSALRRIATTSEQNIASQCCLSLATLVLLSYNESAMGNFPGFSVHSEGISKIIELSFDRLSSSLMGKQLVAAWFLSKYHNWWLRVYFSTFSFQLSQPSMKPSGPIETLLKDIGAQKTLITSILCESHRISSKAVLHFWPGQEGGTFDPQLEQYITLLQSESQKLDQWHLGLDLSELPIESFSNSRRENSFVDVGTALTAAGPLFFNSQDSALNYAYYATARIMQCTTLLHRLGMDHDEITVGIMDSDDDEIAYWTVILIRVIAGLDKFELARKNVYSIGITSLLLTCNLRCHDLATGRWIENWIREWTLHTTIEEGSFPVMQALAVVEVINEHRALGKDVYAVAVPFDDGGGEGKFASYYSQELRFISLKGKDRSTGYLFSETVSVHLN